MSSIARYEILISIHSFTASISTFDGDIWKYEENIRIYDDRSMSRSQRYPRILESQKNTWTVLSIFSWKKFVNGLSARFFSRKIPHREVCIWVGESRNKYFCCFSFLISDWNSRFLYFFEKLRIHLRKSILVIESVYKFEDIGFFSCFFWELESDMWSLSKREFFSDMTFDIMSCWSDKMREFFLILLGSDIDICIGVVRTHLDSIHRNNPKIMWLHLFIEEYGFACIGTDDISETFLSEIHVKAKTKNRGTFCSESIVKTQKKER